MSREQNWYIRRYVRAVSTFLPCSGKRKKPWLADLRAQAESYVAEGGDAAALEQRFGTPQQMAFSYVDEMPTADLLAELHIRRRLVAFICLYLWLFHIDIRGKIADALIGVSVRHRKEVHGVPPVIDYIRDG